MTTTFAPNTPFTSFPSTPGISPWTSAFSNSPFSGPFNSPFNTPWAQIPGMSTPSFQSSAPINTVVTDPMFNGTWGNFGQPSTPFSGSPTVWNAPLANSFGGPQNFSQIPSWSYSPVNTAPLASPINTAVYNSVPFSSVPFNSLGICPFGSTPAFNNTFNNGFNPFFNQGFTNGYSNTINPFFNNTPSYAGNTFGNSFFNHGPFNHGFGSTPNGFVNSLGIQGYSPFDAYANGPWNTPINGFTNGLYSQPFASPYSAAPFFNAYNTPFNAVPFFGPFNAPQGYAWPNGIVANQPVSANGVNTNNTQQGMNINRDAA